jgi:hypothetical protein
LSLNAARRDKGTKNGVYWSEFEYNRHATTLPMEALRARSLAFAVVQLCPNLLCDAMRSFEYAILLAVLAIDRNDHGLRRRKLRRQH